MRVLWCTMEHNSHMIKAHTNDDNSSRSMHRLFVLAHITLLTFPFNAHGRETMLHPFIQCKRVPKKYWRRSWHGPRTRFHICPYNGRTELLQVKFMEFVPHISLSNCFKEQNSINTHTPFYASATV